MALATNQLAFLAAYRMTGNVTRAAAAAQCDRSTHYKIWLNNEEYREAFADAEEEAADHLISEARRRAVEGVKKLKFFQGQLIKIPMRDADGNVMLDADGNVMEEPYVEHDYSDTMLIFLIKGARPEVYRDNVNMSVNGNMAVAAVDAKLRQQMIENPDAAESLCNALEQLQTGASVGSDGDASGDGLVD